VLRSARCWFCWVLSRRAHLFMKSIWRLFLGLPQLLHSFNRKVYPETEISVTLDRQVREKACCLPSSSELLLTNLKFSLNACWRLTIEIMRVGATYMVNLDRLWEGRCSFLWMVGLRMRSFVLMTAEDGYFLCAGDGIVEERKFSRETGAGTYLQIELGSWTAVAKYYFAFSCMCSESFVESDRGLWITLRCAEPTRKQIPT
jgi:hypothetical protein